MHQFEYAKIVSMAIDNMDTMRLHHTKDHILYVPWNALAPGKGSQSLLLSYFGFNLYTGGGNVVLLARYANRF